MSCPVCEKRTLEEKKAASDCKQEVKQLEAKSVRLTIILTALGTLVGQELLDSRIPFRFLALHHRLNRTWFTQIQISPKVLMNTRNQTNGLLSVIVSQA